MKQDFDRAMTLFSWSNPYAWPRKPLLAQNVVATSQPLAAQAGLQMLPTAGTRWTRSALPRITLTMVEPMSNGIGSDLYAMVWDGASSHGLNAGPLAGAWTPEYFRGKAVCRRAAGTRSRAGLRIGWAELDSTFASCRSETLRAGDPLRLRRLSVSPIIARHWQAEVDKLKNQPGFAQTFLPGGSAPRAGERFVFTKHAAALEIAETRERRLSRASWPQSSMRRRRSSDERCARPTSRRTGPTGVEHLTLDHRGDTLHEIRRTARASCALIALGILTRDLAIAPGGRRTAPTSRSRR